MSDFAEKETHPVFPVFLLVDVSYSMAATDVASGLSPLDAVNQALPELKAAVQTDPTVGEIARIGLITFSETARLVLPLCDLLYADMPILGPEGGTNFAAAFRLAKSEIEDGVRSLGKGTRFHKPVVFFMSDGHHLASADPWEGPLRSLTDSDFKFNPEIVAFGFGEAKSDELRKIATRYAFMAKDADPASQVREIISTLIGSIKTTSHSLRSGVQGGLVVQPDPNKFTPLPVLEV